MATYTVVTKHKWTIGNFSQRISVVEQGGSIFSDVFSLNGNSKATFLIKLERNRESDCHISLICNDFGHSQEIKLDMKYWLEYPGNKIISIRNRKITFNNSSNVGFFLDGYYISYMKKFAVYDILIIDCEITHEEPISENDSDDDDKKESIAHREFSRKLFALHSDGHSDLTIQAGGKEFKTSKSMLMACSDVFHRMFTCPNSIEAQTGFIKMENTKPEVIDALLRWIYQVEIENMEKLAMDLYKTADKYGISALKEKCVKVMKKDLSKKNVASRLILAYKYNEDQIKQRALNFLREDYKNVGGLMTSGEWVELCNEDLEEAKKIESDIFG